MNKAMLANALATIGLFGMESSVERSQPFLDKTAHAQKVVLTYAVPNPDSCYTNIRSDYNTDHYVSTLEESNNDGSFVSRLLLCCCGKKAEKKDVSILISQTDTN